MLQAVYQWRKDPNGSMTFIAFKDVNRQRMDTISYWVIWEAEGTVLYDWFYDDWVREWPITKPSSKDMQMVIKVLFEEPQGFLDIYKETK